MFTAHLPAGYIAAKQIYPRLAAPSGTPYRLFLAAALLGAIAPDFDLLYFYLTGAHEHHHTLWPHFPVLWAGLLLCSALWWRSGRARRHAALAAIFSFNGMVHMLLDTVVGNIWWLAPFDMEFHLSLFTVPPRYHPWWLNFLFHWSFLCELCINLWAFQLWRRRPGAPIPEAA